MWRSRSLCLSDHHKSHRRVFPHPSTPLLSTSRGRRGKPRPGLCWREEDPFIAHLIALPVEGRRLRPCGSQGDTHTQTEKKKKTPWGPGISLSAQLTQTGRHSCRCTVSEQLPHVCVCVNVCACVSQGLPYLRHQP